MSNKKKIFSEFEYKSNNKKFQIEGKDGVFKYSGVGSYSGDVDCIIVEEVNTGKKEYIYDNLYIKYKEEK